MKNKLTEHVQSIGKEFDEKFGVVIVDEGPDAGFEYLSHFPSVEILKSHLLSSQLSIIQAIDEWAEKKLQDKEISNGYYNAMNDLRSFLEEAKTKLQ